MIITVTEKNIADGLPNNPAHCPIACALFDLGAICADVGEQEIYWQFADGSKFIADTPQAARQFIAIVDDPHSKPEPIDFEVQEFAYED